MVSSRNLRTPADPPDLLLLANKLAPPDSTPARPALPLASLARAGPISQCELPLLATANEVEDEEDVDDEEEEDETALSLLLLVRNTSAYLSRISSLYASSCIDDRRGTNRSKLH